MGLSSLYANLFVSVSCLLVIFHIFVTCLLSGHFLKIQAHSGTKFYGNYFLLQISDGCNKMVCGKCGTLFCWLCEECLNPEDPYKHFSNPASKCYNILFNDVLNLDDDDDHWWNAGGVFVENAYDYGYFDDEDEDNL